ncbi:MAG: glycosyltransferase family 4 protein [Methylotenera sp.]|uniref:glycosyltransferase family 4 protein n=1 Tax=Methylotenera sp. TaxID=2051956 RepID=UPI002488EB54|nr:glycosyltransferase family 4 protein [Methylotenera sp.]MDI1308261.1 glycosyltransferase family 4 protein [Methylotenera sp.]
MLRIANDCAKLGHTVTIYTGEWRGDKPQGNVQHIILPSKGLLNHQRYQCLLDAMHAALKLEPVDFVVGFNRMEGLDAYYAADPCFIARAYEEKSWFYRLSARFRFFKRCENAVFAKQSNCEILLLTSRDKMEFQHWYQTPDSRLHLLPPNIPVDKFKNKDRTSARSYLLKQFDLPEQANVILTVGSAYIRKGVDRVITALAALPTAVRDNTWLVAVGEYESSNTFNKDAKKLGIAGRCIQAGGRADVADLMLGANLLAHPARSELAGLVIIEAMTAGLPVLLTDVCGYASHVKNAGAGVVLDSPFNQSQCNQALYAMLMADSLTWAQGAIDYTQNILRNSSPSSEADLIIGFALTKQNSKNNEAD